MSNPYHEWRKKLAEEDPDLAFRAVPAGFIEELNEAAETEGLTKDEVIESLLTGKIKRDSDTPMN